MSIDGTRVRATPLLNVDDITYDYAFTIPAGGTVILMHFASQNPNRAVAQTSAAQILSLASPALSGLSAAERAAIVNFVVP